MKSKIITITLSPCIDKSTSVDKFIPEKKLKCAYPLLEAGGGGINVSRALKNFKTNSLCIYIAGGYTGKILSNLVYHEGLHAVTVNSDLNTRENFIVFENQTHLQFRFGMPVNKVADSEWKKVIAALKKEKASDVILSGSINSSISPLFFEEINAYVKKHKCRLIVDTAGEPLKNILKTGAFLIKPNQNEFSGLFGKKQLTVKQTISKAKTLIKSNKVENIIVSLGGDGAILVNKNTALHFTPPKVVVKSTVGAGDSMIAGIVYQLKNGHTIEEAVKFGIACGTATTNNSGMQLCTLKGAERILKRVEIRKV
jgi:6-phosphofructokinase 2